MACPRIRAVAEPVLRKSYKRRLATGHSLSAGGGVGIAVAALALLLGATYYGHRQLKRRRNDEDVYKHRQFTYEDDDSFTAIVTGAHPMGAQVVQVIDDSHVYAASDDEIEVKALKAEELDLAAIEESEDEISQHEWCASPNCERCELARQSGVQFIGAGQRFSPRVASVPRNARRPYIADDTVDL